MIDTKEIANEIFKELKPLIKCIKSIDTKAPEGKLKPLSVTNSLTDIIYLIERMKALGIISITNRSKDIEKLLSFNGKEVKHYNQTKHKIFDEFANYNPNYDIIEKSKLDSLQINEKKYYESQSEDYNNHKNKNKVMIPASEYNDLLKQSNQLKTLETENLQLKTTVETLYNLSSMQSEIKQSVENGKEVLNTN